MIQFALVRQVRGAIRISLPVAIASAMRRSVQHTCKYTGPRFTFDSAAW